MTKPLALFLTDFGRPAVPFPSLPTFEGDDLDAIGAGPDLDEQLADARREGYAEGEAAARAEGEAEVEALKAGYETRMEEARRDWVAEQGDVLAGLLRDGLAAVEVALADALAGLMEPVLREAVRDKTLAEVRDAIATLLAGADGAIIRVTGPADLVEATEAALAPSSGIEFATDDEAVELTVLAGDTTVRSALEPWAQRLRSLMTEGP